MKKIIACLLTCITLAGCARPASRTQPSTQPTVTETEPTEEVVRYSPITAANGISDSIYFSNCYKDRTVSRDAAVATWGAASLSAGALQVYYALVCAGHPGIDNCAPAPEVPLWAQLSPAEGGRLSWEQFYLRRAISLWQGVSALNYAAGQPLPFIDSGYLPSETQHAQYISEDLPMVSTIYNPAKPYALPPMHRQYIDTLPQKLQEAAQKSGYADPESLARSVGTDAQTLLSVCSDINRAYSYYVELNAFVRSTEPATDKRIDIRQMLVLPEGEVRPDGTVMASEEAWESAENEAAQYLRTWKSSYAAAKQAENAFASLAHDHSADTATASDGGSLNAIVPGQLISELDSWCFAPERQPGDTAAIRTPYGISIVYYAGASARQSGASGMNQLLTELIRSFALQVDYSAAALQESSGALSLSDILYPDIGHEQIAEIPTFFQQDYPYVNCGGTTMPIGGCGFASLAMLATYLSDTLITPTQIAERYAREYGSAGGINGDIFLRIPPELGFYSAGICNRWDAAQEAMAKGAPSVSLQIGGPFTTAGHFIVLAHLLEDGTVVVRDPSITHYAKLSGFRDAGFEPRIVQMGASQFWLFDSKILTIPACTRCGSGGCYALTGEYLCRKCRIALDRRSSFMNNAMTILE